MDERHEKKMKRGVFFLPRVKRGKILRTVVAKEGNLVGSHFYEETSNEFPRFSVLLAVKLILNSMHDW
jgi:hypothetical protein